MNSLSLYVHIPFCVRRCPYCAFYHVRPAPGDESAFLNALVSEIEQTLGAAVGPIRLQTVFFGGGTPSVIGRDSWSRIFEALDPHLQPAAEVTCELNPEDVRDAMLSHLRSLGVNRISLGVQSMEKASQQLLGRCSPEANRRAMERVRRVFQNVSFDVLLGIPGRDPCALERSLRQLVGYGPQHLSVYCLEPGGDLDEQAAAFFEAVDSEGVADEYLFSCDLLEGAGFRHYEVSNFALPGYESAHNRCYWNGGEYLGVGPAAHSYRNGRRFHNPPSLSRYLETAGFPPETRYIRDDPGPEGLEVERLMLGLRTADGLEVETLHCPRGAIDAMLMDGLAAVAGGRLRLTNRGFLLLNEIVLKLLSGRPKTETPCCREKNKNCCEQ